MSCCSIRFSAAFLLVVVVGAGPQAVSANTVYDKAIRVLIVDGFSNHDWKRNTWWLRQILEPTGRFLIDVSTAPSTTNAPGWDDWRPRFGDYDVILQTCNDIRGGPAWPRAVQADFESFAHGGGGIYIYHSANNAFPDWPAYNAMIGLGWRDSDYGTALAFDTAGALIRIPPGEGAATQHGPRSTVLVHQRGDHPIHADLPRAWLSPDLEVYRYARGPAENIEVIAFAWDATTQLNWPIEWTVTYGQGRIFVSTFGHMMARPLNPEGMRSADHQTLMVRALQWLAGREPDLPVPPDFPSAEHVSVRDKLE